MFGNVVHTHAFFGMYGDDDDDGYDESVYECYGTCGETIKNCKKDSHKETMEEVGGYGYSYDDTLGYEEYVAKVKEQEGEYERMYVIYF